MDEETIQIPISEYENFRDRLMYQDKHSLMRELQQLLQDKDEDLKRYKDLLETKDTVLKRTQKQLDRLMQTHKADKPVRLLVARSMNSRAPTPNSSKPELISRAVGGNTDEKQDRQATEHDETMSMPANQNSTIESESMPADHLKSLPIGLSRAGLAPGMSSALLQKLVSENLTLRKQVEALNNGKPLKINKDSQVQELKFQLKKKENQLDELKKQLRNFPLGKDSNISPTDSVCSYLEEKVERLENTLEMKKVVIASLKDQKECIEKEKSGLDTLLEKYRAETDEKYRQAENSYNEDRITELEKEVDQRRKAQESTTTKLDSVQKELDSIKIRFEAMEQERDMAVQNYETLVTEFQRPSPVHQPPRSIGPTIRQPFAMSPSSTYSQYTQSSPTSRLDQISGMDYISRQTSRTEPPVLPPRMQTTQHRNTASGSNRAPAPPPRDNKRTLKCPRCEAVFDLLQAYREHIKVCLKSSS